MAVYVWHCDRSGGYSMYSSGVEDQNSLRGVQVADAGGVVRFTSIVPAEVCDAVYAEPGYEGSVTDLAGASLETDGIFADGGGAGQVATVTGDVDAGYAVSLLVPVDTSTEPTGGGMGGGPGSGGGPGGPGGGPGGDGGTAPEGTSPSGDRPS